MCGIAGKFNRRTAQPVTEDDLCPMLALLRHRGPDEFGALLDGEAGLGSARLSIIDLHRGGQPISNEDESLWIVFNGEVFNHLELRADLEKRGHHFRTDSDTEVILHLFEDSGPDCLNRLNGQFAIALWDSKRRRLFLARDRLGVRPLFYAQLPDGSLIFASEIKAILSDPRVHAEMDPTILAQIFTFWAPVASNTVFRGIQELPPGHHLIADRDAVRVERYWQLRFPADPVAATDQGADEVVEEFRALLIDACRIRLRADVPVGAYLSGGVDSSTIATVARQHTSNHRLMTFSIAFSDPRFDEAAFQLQMARHLGTDHQVVRATDADIGRVFPDVIWHTEVPVMRTAPAPMFLLSKLVRDHGFKVVVTGEGADEFLAGYDIFKEAKIRRFWARRPESSRRPLLFKRLYHDIEGMAQGSPAFLAAFFGERFEEVECPVYSHLVRWRNNGRACRFFADSVRGVTPTRPWDGLVQSLPAEFARWEPLAQAQYLEITLFLPQYLLSSQGDRMAMAHSIEARFPFLDPRLVEFCNRLHPRMKLRCLREKYLLKKAAQAWIPEAILRRPKRPYRAPVRRSFFNESAPEYVRELLSPRRIKATGFFNPRSVEQLVRKAETGTAFSETDGMALVGILSSQLVHHLFVEDFRQPAPLTAKDLTRICRAPSRQPKQFQHELP